MRGGGLLPICYWLSTVGFLLLVLAGAGAGALCGGYTIVLLLLRCKIYHDGDGSGDKGG